MSTLTMTFARLGDTSARPVFTSFELTHTKTGAQNMVDFISNIDNGNLLTDVAPELIALNRAQADLLIGHLDKAIRDDAYPKDCLSGMLPPIDEMLEMTAQGCDLYIHANSVTPSPWASHIEA